MKHFNNQDPQVRAELAKLVPLLTEMARRQNPKRCRARDCSKHPDTAKQTATIAAFYVAMRHGRTEA